MIKPEFAWNKMYVHIMNIWDKLDKTKLFKDQYYDENLHITEYINDYNEHLLLLKYNLYNSDIFSNPDSIYREARSLVVNLNNGDIVLCPFQKFFNIGEIPETDLSIVKEQIKKASLIEFSNKLDGSMQSARWYNRHIVFSGSSALNSDQSLHLRQTYHLFNDKHEKLCKENPSYTFIFELITDLDRHIVNYSGDHLYLIGARNIYTGKTLSYNEIINLGKLYNISTVETENITLQQCLLNQSKYSASDKEGWVIYLRVPAETGNSENYNEYRYKLKCDDYVQFHKILGNLLSTNIIVELFVQGKTDDLIAKVPEAYKAIVKERIANIRKYVQQKMKIINDYFSSINIQFKTDNKTFANYVQSHIPKDYQPYMYMLNKHKSFDLLVKNNKYTKYETIMEFLENIRDE